MWLVTGGAGYIGSHVTRDLIAAGYDVVVVDDLSTGVAERVPDPVPLVRTDVRDEGALLAAISAHDITGILHLAARKDVAESVSDPLRYYDENVAGVHAVLDAARRSAVRDIVYSSSAAVYGTPATARATEASPTDPENAYGRSKLIGEWMVDDAASAYDLRVVSLRYFNVAGAGAPDLGDAGETNLLPRLLRAAQDDQPALVFGGDYPTRDGSCVRDYIHVRDISSAHVRAVEALTAGTVTRDVLNVGGGNGVTVLEMIDAVGRAIGRPLDYRIVERRPGDPASVVAAPERIGERLGWKARFTLDDIVTSAWQALRHRTYQEGRK